MEDTSISTGSVDTAAEFSSALDSAFDSADAGEETEVAEVAEETTEAVDEPAETPVEETVEEQTEETEQTEQVEEEKPAEESEDRIRERNGKKEYVLPEARYQRVYGAYKAAQTAEGILGEPLTEELVQSLQADRVAQISMVNDFLSPDPSDQGRFLENFAVMAREAQQAGDVGHNPIATLAEQFVPFLEKHNPEALKPIYSWGRDRAVADLKSLAVEQAKQGNKDLLYSVQYIEKALYNRFTPEADMLKSAAAPDALEERERAISEREQAIQNQQKQAAQQRFQTWYGGINKGIGESITSEVDSRVSQIADAWKQFPNAFNALKKELHNHVVSEIKKDAQWVNLRKAELRQAQIAATEQSREQIGAGLKERYKAKAAMLLDPARNPRVKEILAEGAQRLKASNTAQHARAAEAAKRREPGSLGSPTPKSVIPPKPNGLSATDEWNRRLQEALR